jgi:ribonuclease BN (tRNA processing enzyme)
VGALELRFIGTGNAFAPGGLCWNGFVVNERFLFEAPPQALQSLNRMGMDANALEAVVISHHHGDHFLGLPFLLLQWKYYGRQSPVTIVGPPGTRDLASDIALRVYPGVFNIKYELNWIEASSGDHVAVAGLELEALAVQHDRRLSGSLGFKATLGGRRFAYTGDTAWCEAVAEMARHAEVLVSECASHSDVLDIHMNLVDDIPKVRAAMDPDAQLVLTHLTPEVTTGGLPNTTIAEDLARYRF